MSKPAHIAFWSSLVLLALVATSWINFDHSRQQKLLERANWSLDKGITLFKEKQYEAALETFKRIPAGIEREWYLRYYQGSTHIMLKDYSAAITYLDQALALEPTNTQIMHALGVAYFKMGKLKMSKAYYASILEIDPQDMEARGLLEVMTNLENRQPQAKEPVPENQQAENG